MARNVSAMSLRRKPSIARLLAGISGGAASLALASMPAPALGQAVNGTPTPQFGISGVSRSTPGLDAVFVTNSEALLDWTASDSGGVFLPEGNTLRFIYDGSTPYTVLNRVTDTAVGGPLSISGTVESSSLGKVWFYNAGGWVVGPKGVFNVGSLVLTSLPITIDPASDTVSRLYGDKNEIRFGTALDPKSLVTIQSGAQINASLANSSYVAVVAPRVEQAGTVSVNGSAAYVAAEAATMTINSGLFDIIVDSGSDDTEGVVHTGATGWPANSSSTDADHRIYLVAVPKNQAMTAVVSGSMGYNGATTASVVDGSIVLSAGYNVAGGNVSADSVVGGNASLTISGLTVGQTGAQTDLIGHASRDVNIDATTSSTSVRGTVDLLARRNVSAKIDNGNSLVADSGLSLGSMNGAKAGNVSVSVAGGGSLNVGGAMDLYSIATGAIQTDPLNGDALLGGSVGEDAASGNVGLTITDGDFNLGSANLKSMATSGVGGLSAGSAIAGDVTIDIVQTDGAASTFGGSLGGVEIYSYAANGAFSLQSPVNGGNAVAGAARLTVHGGTFDSSSIAIASDAGTFAGVEAVPLNATAGAVSISFANGNGSFSTGGISAANYATASDGGLATLGDVSLSYDNVQSVTSDSFGSIGLQSYAYGNLITPNTVSLTLSGSSNLETFGSVVSLQAEGRNDTVTQLAGNVSFVADASTLSASQLYLNSQAFASGSGIDAVGGNVSANLQNGANVNLGVAASLQSTARGGSGPDGGSGTGGTVSFTIADSSFTAVDSPFSDGLSLLSNGVAGRRTDGAGRSGTGLGGTVSFIQTGKPTSVLVNSVTLTSLGQGGRPDISARTGLVAQAGDGASGVGGDVSFSVAEGTFSASSLTIEATGEGGNGDNVAGFAPGTGGSGTGGTSTLSITGGLLTASTVDVTASGFGGDGAQSSDALGIVGGIGGAGTGGSATVNLTGGTLRAEGLTVEANGNKSQSDGFGVSYFGNGGYDFNGTGAAGDGGLGTGGNALLTIDGGSLGEIPFSSAGLPVTVTVNAIGEGGAGGFTFGSSGVGNRSGAGGNGQGGTAGIRFLSGTFDAQMIGIDATGLGGLAGNDANTAGEFALNAGKGGDGAGGTSTLELVGNFGVATTSGSTRNLEVRADGIGQAGESGLIGGEGGSGLGGTARILVSGGSSSFADPVLSAEGLGKAGGNSTDGYGGGAGGSGTGGQAVIAVTGDGTNLSIAGASLRVSGLGGAGGRGGAGSDAVDEAGDGGAGGAGTGGAISLVASDLGQLNSTGTEGSLFASNGIGGAGGLGGNSAANGWRTLGDGGDGGSGRGGTVDALAQGGGVITFDDLTLGTNGLGGAGGSFVSLDVSGTFDQSVGGAGGAGFGGSISVQAVGLNSRVEAPSLVANANGRGGAGVNGSGYAVDGSSADGSAGGSGTGGSISVLADAGGAIALATADGNVGLSANGIGGNGGSAFAAITASTGIGGNGGNGGDSGSGTGGTVAIAALDDGTASLGLLGTVTLSANGIGGIAGLGGDGANSTAPVTLGGNGGNNGLAEAGRGGTVTVGAAGGVAIFGTLLANATGETFDRPFAGAGGSGTSGVGLPGSSAFVTPSGGQVFFSSADGSLSSTGSLVAGATSVDVRSKRTFPASNFAFINELGGTISLTSSSTAPVDAMRFASFSGDASGSFAGFSDPAISLTAVSGPIAFDGDLNLLAAGSISLSVADGLSITAGGSAYLGSDTGIDIAAAGTGQFSGNSIELQSRGGIGIAVAGCATTTCRPIEATTSLLADASGDFTISGPAIVAGLGSLDVYAFGNVTGDAASGYFSGGNLRVRAGQDATIRNASGATLDLEAGAIPDGATLYFDGLLTLGEVGGGGLFNAAGDIVFASGGGIAVTGGNSFSTGTGIDVRSGNDIIVGRNNSFVANTSAAVPGLPVTFAAGGLTLQYSLAPEDIAVLAFGSGTTVSAGTGAIALSGAAIDARLATFTGASFRADVLQTLGLTSPRRNNGERLDPDCLEGAICIGDIDVSGTVRIGNTDTVPLDIRAVGTISGSDVRLLATGNVTLEGVGRVAQIVSTGNLSIRSVLGDIALLDGAVVEGGTVRLAAGANIFGTGNVTATVDDIGLFAGGDIDAASLTAARELTTDLAAGGLAEGAFSTLGALRVGALTLGASTDITTGTSLEIGALALGGFNGSLSAGTVLDLGSTTDVNDLSLSAGTSVGFTSLLVDGNLVISGPSVTGTSAQAGGTLSITSDSLAADLLQSAGDLTLTVTNTAALGAVNSTGGSVTIDPALLTFDAITSASGITLSGGVITGGTLDAGTSIEVTATGALTLASANAGTTMSLGADSLQSGALDAGDSLTLTIANGATLTGAATAGGDLVASFGTLDFTTLGATGLVSLEGTDLTGSSITAGISLTALLAGNYAVTDAQSGTSLSLQSATATATTLSAGANLDATVTGLADLADVSALGDLTLSAGSLLSGSITAGGLVGIDVSGTATVGATTAGTTLTFDAGTLNADSLDAGTVLSLTAANAATITGTASAGTDASVSAASLTGGSFTATGNLGITTTGNAAFADASAGGALTLSGADVSITSLSGKTVDITATNVLGNSIALTDALSINATGDITLALIGPTAGTVDITGASLSLDLVNAGDLGIAISGDALIGSVLGSGKVTLSAANLQVDSLGAAGVVSLSGTTIGAGTILADSDLGISATGNVTLDRAEAGGTLAITAAGLGANTLQSADDLTLTVANTAALGTVTSTGGSIFIDPALLTFDAITSASGITLSGGTITGGTLDAGGAVDVNATGALTLTSARSGTTLSLIGASIQAGSLSSGATSSVAAQDLVSITNAINSGGDVSITAAGLATPLLQSNSGNVTLAISGLADLSNVAASGGDLLINAGTLRFASASGLRAVRLSGTDIAGTTVTSGTSTSISASLIANVGTVTAGSSATINGQDLTVSKVTAGTFTDFDGRIINVGETTAGTTAFVDAGDFIFDKLTAGESVEILSAGDTTGGSLIAGTTLSISARGDAQLDDAQAGGAITIGAANLNALTVTGDAGLSLVVTNAIDLDTVKVLGSFDLSGASLNLGSSSSGLDSTFSLTGNATIGSVAAGLATTGQNLVQIVVQALANSYTGGTLAPVFDVVQGQTITVSSSTNDLWSAGSLPRISDGDGLVVFRVATAQDDSGFQPGTQIGAAFGNLTIGNFSAPFGALVGQIGNETVLLGANGTVTAPATGTLSVGYWDSNAGDNFGSIAFTFGTGGGGGSVSSPANVSITTGGNLTVGSAAASSAITLDAAGALKLDTADAGTALSLTGNTIDAGTLMAGTNIAIASTGTSVIGNASAGGSFSADVGALDFTLIDADGAVDIRSLTGTRGGDITSGASITIDEDGAITLGNATATGTVDLAADGSLTYGKLDGGSVAVSAASASGGAITARTGSLALTTIGDLSTGALDARGAITLSARDATLASARSDDDIGANVRSFASPSISAAGNFIITGTGAVEVGTASGGDALNVTSQTLTFTRMTAGNALNITTSGDITGGDLVATGQMRINSGNGNFTYGTLDGGDIAIVGGSIAGGVLQARTGAVNIAVARSAALGAITAAANVGIDARTLAFSTINAGGAFGTNNGTMTGTSISAGQDISIFSQGDVSLSGLSGGVAAVRSNGVVNITGIELTGPISVSADAVGLDATGNLAIRRIFAERGNVDVTAGGSIDADTILALGDIDLLARNGDVTVGDLSAGYSDVFSDAVRPQGQVSGAVGQGNIDIVASDNIVINDVADAAQVFTMTAGDTIRINGLATGGQMDLSSADLAIGDSGRLGETAHTSAITLRNTGQGVTRLGDNIPSTTGGYAISQAEFARIRSRGDLTIRGIRPMLVGDLTVVAQAGTVQGQIGETGTLSLRSTGLISFLGGLSMSNAAGNTLSVSSSADGIFLDAQTGSIRLLEGETRGGSLLLSGSGIAMVTRTALGDIAQLTDTALITDRLGLNDGVTDGRTLVEADAITLRSDEQVYIQNTSIGTRLDDRRGLVANSLRIGSREGGVLDIVINGIVNGQTGVDAIEQITFEEAFTDLSSVNGCVILSANTCNKLPFEIIELRDLIEEVLKNDPADNALQVVDSFTKTSLIQLNQIAPAGFEPLIDEPVTGTGNDDLLGEGKQDGE
ncbi:hypothetical protein [Novosphingobium taihuense]|uniref:Filamentous hemagglutinin family protein n=1 Tax=Novosphingobium taihuense TaxID=260085 RepID=A0A7W7A8R2_9SPHN|nr:hypothetical protein [Novosphingobium taihuense]MBB4612490.1 filamentous hemagglutinin family protein [Novosphingobium taihuense]TWH88158.1 hypothetical protein IQ25_00273 [Novosphingobium taihuense]